MFKFKLGAKIGQAFVLVVAVICGWSARGVRADEAADIDELIKLQERCNEHRAAGRLPEAQTAAEEMLALTEARLTSRPDIRMICLNNLANLHEEQRQFDASERLWRRSLEVVESAFGPDDPRVAMSLSNLAMLHENIGKFDQAEQGFQKSLRIFEQDASQSPNVARCLNDIGNLYHTLERYADAETAYKRSLAIRERLQPPAPDDVAMSLGNLAVIYSQLGRYADAEPLSNKALAIREQLLGKNDPAVAMSLNNLAILYLDQDRLDEAERAGQRAIAIYEAALGPDHPDVADSLNNLAAVYTNQDRDTEAEALYERARKIFVQHRGADHPDVAACLSNLAGVCEDQGRFDDAETLFKQAAGIVENALGKDHPRVAEVLHSLARMYVEQGRMEEAGPMFDRVITLRDRAGVAAGERAWSYLNRAELRWRQGERDSAMADLRQAMELAESQRTRTSGAEQDRARTFSGFGEIYERMIAWQSELGDLNAVLQAKERGLARALVDQIQAQGVDPFVGLAANEATALRRRDADAKTRVASLERQLEVLKIQGGLAESDRERREADLNANLNAARDELVAVYRDVRNASPAYRLSVNREFKPVSLEDLQADAQRQRALLLHYLIGEEKSFVLVVPPEGQPRLVNLQTSQELATDLGIEAGELTAERVAAALRIGERTLPQVLSRPDGVYSAPRGLTRPEPRSSREAKARLAALWRLLVPEAEREALAAGTYRRWIVVPDASLAGLPFETLIVAGGDDPKFVLDVAPPIQYAPSATLLFNLWQRDAVTSLKGQTVLSVGDPKYMAQAATSFRDLATARSADSRYARGGGSLPRLPHSGTESRWVCQVLKKAGCDCRQLTGGKATEAQVCAAAGGARIVHFACHGLVDQKYGNFFGALALAPSGGTAYNAADDGFLTLPEIYALNLTGCELAILSACETNYGPQQKGEGLWALSRGFLAAGSRRVVASNWLVDDEAAASLVSYFCGGLAKTGEDASSLDYAVALHEAKKWVRKQEKWANPYYWGTFVLIGPG
jgi:tetratricopeptide (TPR) repeat protein